MIAAVHHAEVIAHRLGEPRVVAHAGEQGPDLGDADNGGFLPVEVVELTFCFDAVLLTVLGAFADSLAEEEDYAVHGEEDRRRKRLREQHAKRMLERQPDRAGGDGGDDKEPAEALSAVLDAPVCDRSDQFPDDLHPGLEVEDEESTPSRVSTRALWSMSHPNRRGRITAWPRLLIGNSSVTPWITPRMIAWRYEMVPWSTGAA